MWAWCTLSAVLQCCLLHHLSPFSCDFFFVHFGFSLKRFLLCCLSFFFQIWQNHLLVKYLFSWYQSALIFFICIASYNLPLFCFHSLSFFLSLAVSVFSHLCLAWHHSSSVSALLVTARQYHTPWGPLHPWVCLQSMNENQQFSKSIIVVSVASIILIIIL